MALLILVAFLSSGCVYRSYREGDTRYTSISLAATQSLGPFSLRAGKEGDASFRALESKGLTNDTASLVETAITAGIKAGR